MTDVAPVEQKPASGNAAWAPPAALRPGPEMAALERFNFNCVWGGKVHAGGMGPGSPEMDGTGRGTFTPLMDGLWLAGDFVQDQFVEGRLVITWRAHFVVGWSPLAREYRATYVDSNGSAALMCGYIDGDRFVVQSLGDEPVKVRLTWERIDPQAPDIKWRNECSINGAPWLLVEEYICKPA